uniref:Uncharacterized protein n=1 Tax=Amphimedon queenslandica TaxID=400682 RepID=A0A1X7TCY2_AMPQE
MKRDNDVRKIRQSAFGEVPLDTDQNDEMCNVISVIEEKCEAELKELFAEGKKHGVGHRMKEIWNNDRNEDAQQYERDQSKNKTGRKSNRWSVITIRIALAIYARSPAAYDALKSFNVLQLPSRSTLQSYTGAFLHQPGANHDSISEQVAQFLLHCHQRKQEGKSRKRLELSSLMKLKSLASCFRTQGAIQLL